MSSVISLLWFFFLSLRPPPGSTLFPYTTLFRSGLRRSIPRRAPAGGRSDGGRLRSGRHGNLPAPSGFRRSEEHTSELQSLRHLVCRLLLEKKKKQKVSAYRYKVREGPRY